MKTALWTFTAAVGLTCLAACGGHDNNTASTMPTGGSGSGSGPTSSGPSSSGPSSSAPSSSAPTDFVAFVNQQVGVEPAFGSAPTDPTTLTTNLALGNATAFTATTFGSGDTVPAGTNLAVTACTQAGSTACNPTVSTDLNSTLN